MRGQRQPALHTSAGSPSLTRLPACRRRDQAHIHSKSWKESLGFTGKPFPERGWNVGLQV